VTGPERGYRLCLLAYPAGYRRERGTELLDTALAAAGSRTWPWLRDSGSLILGGLRVRAGQDGRLATAASLRLAVLFGVVLWLAGQISASLAFAGESWLHWVPPGQHAAYTAFRGLLMLAAVVAAWIAPRPAVLAISLTGAAACAFPWQGPWPLLGEPALLAALALLAQGKQRMPRLWLWLLGPGLTLQTLTPLADWRFHPLSFMSPWLNDLPLAIVAVVVLWAAVDARPAIAVGVAAAVGRVIPLVTGWHDNTFGHVFFWPLAWGTLLALVAALRLHRQTVL
jgi:hypothetical protein